MIMDGLSDHHQLTTLRDKLYSSFKFACSVMYGSSGILISKVVPSCTREILVLIFRKPVDCKTYPMITAATDSSEEVSKFAMLLFSEVVKVPFV